MMHWVPRNPHFSLSPTPRPPTGSHHAAKASCLHLPRDGSCIPESSLSTLVQPQSVSFFPSFSFLFPSLLPFPTPSFSFVILGMCGFASLSPHCCQPHSLAGSPAVEQNKMKPWALLSTKASCYYHYRAHRSTPCLCVFPTSGLGSGAVSITIGPGAPYRHSLTPATATQDSGSLFPPLAIGTLSTILSTHSVLSPHLLVRKFRDAQTLKIQTPEPSL